MLRTAPQLLTIVRTWGYNRENPENWIVIVHIRVAAVEEAVAVDVLIVVLVLRGGGGSSSTHRKNVGEVGAG